MTRKKTSLYISASQNTKMGGDKKETVVSPMLLHSLSGMLSGSIAMIITYPLDSMKVRIMAQDGSLQRSLDGVKDYRGLGHAFKRNYHAGGVSSMYKGVGTAVLASATTWGMYFGLYKQTQAALREFLQSGNKTTDSAGGVGDFCAATASGILTTLATCPLWVVKTRMQLQRGAAGSVVQYRNTRHAIRRIIRTEGSRGLYSGLTPSLLMTSHGSIQMTFYEKIKQVLLTTNILYGSAPAGSVRKMNGVETAVATISSKIVASCFATPLVVLRTRMQDPRNATNASDYRYTSLLQASRMTVRQEGVRGLFRGLTPTLIRTVPSYVITFLTYETISDYLFLMFEKG